MNEIFGRLPSCALEDETEFFSHLKRAILRCSFVGVGTGPALQDLHVGLVGKAREG